MEGDGEQGGESGGQTGIFANCEYGQYTADQPLSVKIRRNINTDRTIRTANYTLDHGSPVSVPFCCVFFKFILVFFAF